MAAAWFKGVQHRICLVYNDTVNKLCHKCFTNSNSIVSALCLVQEETVKTGFCHERVHKQQVWLLRNRGSCRRDTGSDTESVRDIEF